MVLAVQPRDQRGYFMLPQAPEDAGYYVYGTPAEGVSQYAHPALISALLWVEREWQAIETRKFGIGNISLANGVDHPDHDSHESGLEVDIRPLRKDGQPVGVRWYQAAYDHAATAKLIALFRLYTPVRLIYFNDPQMPGVRPYPNHDNHLHLELKVPA